MYCVYLLQSENCSYIGMTNDFLRRWMQHNGYLSGGAKYTSKKKDWTPLCIIDGFQNKREARQCEWRWKRKRGYSQRMYYLRNILLNQKQWTSKSPLIHSQNLTIYTLNIYRDLFQIIPQNIRELEWF